MANSQYYFSCIDLQVSLIFRAPGVLKSVIEKSLINYDFLQSVKLARKMNKYLSVNWSFFFLII